MQIAATNYWVNNGERGIFTSLLLPLALLLCQAVQAVYDGGHLGLSGLLGLLSGPLQQLPPCYATLPQEQPSPEHHTQGLQIQILLGHRVAC